MSFQPQRGREFGGTHSTCPTSQLMNPSKGHSVPGVAERVTPEAPAQGRSGHSPAAVTRTPFRQRCFSHDGHFPPPHLHRDAARPCRGHVDTRLRSPSQAMAEPGSGLDAGPSDSARYDMTFWPLGPYSFTKWFHAKIAQRLQKWRDGKTPLKMPSLFIRGRKMSNCHSVQNDSGTRGLQWESIEPLVRNKDDLET